MSKNVVKNVKDIKQVQQQISEQMNKIKEAFKKKGINCEIMVDDNEVYVVLSLTDIINLYKKQMTQAFPGIEFKTYIVEDRLIMVFKK